MKPLTEILHSIQYIMTSNRGNFVHFLLNNSCRARESAFLPLPLFSNSGINNSTMIANFIFSIFDYVKTNVLIHNHLSEQVTTLRHNNVIS